MVITSKRRLKSLLSIMLAAWLWPAGTRAQSPPVIVEYYHVDAIGSVRAVTNAAGAVVRRHDYAPFGEELTTVIALGAVRFVGKERDDETGFDYSMARFYAAEWGRFTTIDPGHIGGDILDPQSWNAYGYARSNPLRFVDPAGTDYIVTLDDHGAFRLGNDDFFRLQRNPGAGFRFNGNFVQQLKNGRWVTIGSVCDELCVLLRDTGDRANTMLKAGTLAVGAGAVVGATGGLAAGMLSGGLGTGGVAALGLAGEVGSTPLIRGALIEGLKVGNHVARKAGLGRGATVEIVRATIRGAKAAGTVTSEVGAGRFAGNAIQIFVHNGVKVVVDTTSKTIMSVSKIGGFHF